LETLTRSLVEDPEARAGGNHGELELKQLVEGGKLGEIGAFRGPAHVSRGGQKRVLDKWPQQRRGAEAKGVCFEARKELGATDASLWRGKV
jgi:hypothetical protein